MAELVGIVRLPASGLNDGADSGFGGGAVALENYFKLTRLAGGFFNLSRFMYGDILVVLDLFDQLSHAGILRLIIRRIFGENLVVIVGPAILFPFASAYPDGLETVAQNADIEEPEGLWHGLMPDYSLPTIGNPYFSTLASGIAGISLVLIFAFLVGIAATRKS